MSTHKSPSESRWNSLQRELGLRLATRLFNELSADPLAIDRKPSGSVTWSLSIAYGAATLVYGTSLILGGLGFALLLRPWQTIFDPLVAAVFLLLCWAARPRVVAPPYYLLRRSDFPTLYALSDRIATELRTQPVHAIAYSADFGANYRQAGWANKPFIELGAPLLAMLDSEERLAIIAHELSHGANRDPLRSNYLHGAVGTLANWGTAFRPAAIGSLGDGLPFGPIVSLLGIPFELVMLALSEFVFLLARGLLLLVLRQSQRAEYLADLLAASVAGSKQLQSALEKTYLAEAVNDVVRRHALTTPYESLGPRMAAAKIEIKAANVESLRAESLASQWQVDTTHPPTALRVRMLDLKPTPALPQLLSTDESQALDVEIERIVALSEREMINRQIEAAGS